MTKYEGTKLQNFEPRGKVENLEIIDLGVWYGRSCQTRRNHNRALHWCAVQKWCDLPELT